MKRIENGDPCRCQDLPSPFFEAKFRCPHCIAGIIESKNVLVKENQQLRGAIILHRSQKADDRCIEDDDRLYEVLGDGIKCDRRVGSKEAMYENCKRFINNRCEEGHWTTYQDLEKERDDLLQILREKGITTQK